MTQESQNLITNSANNGLAIVCVSVIAVVLIVCITYLIRTGKFGTWEWIKGKGVTYVPSDNGNEVALLFIDTMLDKAEYDFKDKMIDVSYESFKDNTFGQKYATRIVALNHCMKDMYSAGFDNYIAKAQQIGRWTDVETENFAKGLLVSARVMIDARLDAYEKSIQLRSSCTFRKITQGKIEKNLKYSKMVDTFLESFGMLTDSIEARHEQRSSVLMENKTGE